MTPTPEAAPRRNTLDVDLPAAAAAVAQSTALGAAPVDATVTGARLTADALITGATATKRTFTVVNKGATGAGSTVVATLDLVTGVNAPAFDEVAFTLSVVTDATKVAAGDVLAVVETVAGAGTANPGGRVEVDLDGR